MYFNVLQLALLLALINCSVFTVVFCENFKAHKSKETPDGQSHEKTDKSLERKRSLHEAHIQDRRFRRAIKSGMPGAKCGTASQCTGNETLFETGGNCYNCYCDNACYETFQDCCQDFVKTCGEQKRTNTKNSQQHWECIALTGSTLGSTNCSLYTPSGTWMIVKCSSKWAFNETRIRCENPPEGISYYVEDYLPVVGKNGLTYRNKHCAECNGESKYKTWDIVVEGPVKPPNEYNLTDKLQFVLANGGVIQNLLPGQDLPRRYCAGARYKDSCSNTSHSAYQECLNGPVERFCKFLTCFKNAACMLCNEENTPFIVRPELIKSIDEALDVPFDEFSTVFLLNEYKRTSPESTSVKVVTKKCIDGLVYDTNWKFCREGVLTDINDNLSNKFLIALWFKTGATKFPTNFPFVPSPSPPMRNIPNIRKLLKSGLIRKFALKPNQLARFQFHRQTSDINTSVVVTFHLTLTPYQEFIMDNQNNISNLNISTESQKFLGLLKFTTNFTVQSGGCRFLVTKLISKQLACYEGKTLQSDEYEIDKISGNVIQNTTGKVFSKNEYAILGKIGGNIIICRRLLLSGCHNGAFVTLYEHEYFVYKNLTIFHYQTNRTFNFGEYQIIEGDGSNQTNLDIFHNASFPTNSTIAICLPFRQTFNTTEKIKITKVATKSNRLHPLQFLTVICFSFSILFLVILLVTYWMFKELRTLPGMNLMSLAVSMLLSQLIWLVGTAQFKNTKICDVLGIIEHYLLLVAFMAMSVISYHSCIVFSRTFGRSPNNTSSVLAKFAKYSSVVWISPAIFIAVCVTLDQTEATFDVYGTTCWLSTAKAVLYLFILPAAVIILFNIATFIKTALALYRNKDDGILRKNGNQNLIACAKLATMVGFPWLFAFFGLTFPDVELLEYLFVVFACLQGFYMGVAFVCNRKTVQLYKNWLENRNTIGAQPGPKNEAFQMS